MLTPSINRFCQVAYRLFILIGMSFILIACASTAISPLESGRKLHERNKHLPTSVTQDSTINSIHVFPYNNRAERQAKKSENDFQQALQFMEQNRWDEASALLSQIAKESPLLAGPVLNLGIIHLHKGEAEQAMAAFKEAANRHPENPYIYLYQGIAQRQLGLFKQAESSYFKSLELAPNYAQANINLGILYELYLQQPEKALIQYKKYQELQDTPDPLVNNWIIFLKNQNL